VAGAVYSGFAMVLALVIPLRKFYGLGDFITERHLDNMAKVLLATGLMVAYGYLMEAFMGWYSGDVFEEALLRNRAAGPYAPEFWLLMFLNVVMPQVLWFRRFRLNLRALFAVSVLVNVGMWLERYVIIVTALSRDFLPSSWGIFRPTVWDHATFFGSIGLFLSLLFLFIRFLPMISIFETRQLLAETEEEKP
jgi:molybdopterin-containing oxidoreductase family membrane subunit